MPAIETASKPAGEIKVQTGPAPGAGVILVVEDEPGVRKLAERSLRQLGCTVLTAISGVDAEKVWELQEDLIQLVITDVVMPDGIDGVELARRLKGRRPDLKVIYTSGYNREIGRDQALFIEGVNFLAKPFTINPLAHLVQRQL